MYCTIKRCTVYCKMKRKEIKIQRSQDSVIKLPHLRLCSFSSDYAAMEPRVVTPRKYIARFIWQQAAGSWGALWAAETRVFTVDLMPSSFSPCRASPAADVLPAAACACVFERLLWLHTATGLQGCSGRFFSSFHLNSNLVWHRLAVSPLLHACCTRTAGCACTLSMYLDTAIYSVF